MAIKLILFDLGGTLVHDSARLPYVREALMVISRFSTSSGEKVKLGVVCEGRSRPEPGIDRSEEFAGLLKATALDEFFRPLARSVTVWSGARGMQPDHSVFAVAAQHWGTTPQETLFVGASLTSLRDVSHYGPAIVGFGTPQPGVPSFSTWLEGPTRIAHIITPAQDRNFEKALAFQLQLTRGISNFKCLFKEHGIFRGRGSQLMPLHDSALKNLNGVYSSITSDVAVTCDADGNIVSVQTPAPTKADLDEAILHVLNLVSQKQLSSCSAVTTPQTTHAVESDAKGRRIIVRQRYSAR